MKKCTIKVLDEVNCVVDGLDPVIKRKCLAALKFKLPYAQHLPSVKFGYWDGMKMFMNMGGKTQINLLDRILPIIEKDGYEIGIEDNRVPFVINIPDIDKNYPSDRKWPADHSTKPNQPIELNDHQVVAINEFLHNLQGIQCLATGAGKTIVTACLSRLIEPYGRTLVVVPSKNLVNQTRDDYKLMGLDVGVFYGDQKDFNNKHIISTWQSIDAMLRQAKNSHDNSKVETFFNGIVAVMCDECHSAKADILFKILTTYLQNVPIRWGLTGTIPKQDFDFCSLLGGIGPVINTVTSKELQDLGHLSKCQVSIIQTQEDKKFQTYPAELEFLVTNPSRVKWMADTITAISESGNVLVLVGRKETGRLLQELIPDSVFVNGAVKVKDRQTEYDEVATTADKVIIATYGVASTGINIPRIFNLVLIEPGKSFVRTIQSVGRSLRKAHDKDFAQVYDLCSATKYSKKHLTERKKWYKEAEFPFDISKVDIS